MWMIKQCSCGCNDFEQEPDDNVIVCAECGCKAKFVHYNEKDGDSK